MFMFQYTMENNHIVSVEMRRNLQTNEKQLSREIKLRFNLSVKIRRDGEKMPVGRR